MPAHKQEMSRLMNSFVQFCLDQLNSVLGSTQGPLGPLLNLMSTTPAAFTTANPVVIASWTTMTAVADAFLGLYVVLKLIQVMYGQATGSVHLPLGSLLARVILTVILIHLSFFLGQELLALTNLLSGLVRADVQGFIRQVNRGHLLTAQQAPGFAILLGIFFLFGLLRVILQALERIVFFNILLIMSGPAFLMSLDPQTAPWFSFWARTYLTTMLAQFLQFLTFGLGFQFLLASKYTGLTGFLLAVAMLNATAAIPGLLSRFAATAGAGVEGAGTVVRGAITAISLIH